MFQVVYSFLSLTHACNVLLSYLTSLYPLHIPRPTSNSLTVLEYGLTWSGSGLGQVTTLLESAGAHCT